MGEESKQNDTGKAPNSEFGVYDLSLTPVGNEPQLNANNGFSTPDLPEVVGSSPGAVPSIALEEVIVTPDPLAPQEVAAISLEDKSLSAAVIDNATKRPETMKPVLPELDNSVLTAAELTNLEAALANSMSFLSFAKGSLVAVALFGVLMLGYLFFRFEATEKSLFEANLSLVDTEVRQEELLKTYNLKLYQLIGFRVSELVWPVLEFDGLAHKQSLTATESAKLKQLKPVIVSNLEQINALTKGLSYSGADSDSKAMRAELLRDVPNELKSSAVSGLIKSQILHQTLTNSGKLKSLASADDSKYAEFLTKFLLEAKVPEAQLLKISQNRLNWSEIIGGIEAATRTVDPNFGDPDAQFITYDNYNFSARNNSILVGGQIRTDDQKTFTKIANLIDAIEESSLFAEVKTRSFTKNEVDNVSNDLAADTEGLDVPAATGSSTYEATLKLDFKLEQTEDAKVKTKAKTKPNSN
jgi:hypothetical protein